jgi:chromosome segregation ATPase
VTRATAAAVDAKTRRMRDLKIAADKLTQEIKDATDALAATKRDVEAAYRQLEATNAECRANVKVAGRRATTAQAKLFAVDLELQRVELLKSLADNDAHDARRRRDAAAATVAKLVDRDAAVAAEMASVQGDIHVLHQDVGASDGDAAAAGNEVLLVQRRLEIERRVRGRILSIENDLLRYLASRRSELPASIIKRLEQRKIAPLPPASEDDPQAMAELQRLMGELSGSPRLGEESPPRAGLRSTSMGEW